ncbi:cell adhesion molecule CEACAM5-like [Pholidichthys leucotaenia]
MTVSNTDLIEFNSSVSLSCSATGLSLSFLWMNGSSEVTDSDRVQITDGGSTLSITTVTRYDKGPFSCHVSNPVSSSTSDPVNLTISYGPDNIDLISPSEEYHAVGSNIIFTCSTVSNPSAQISWFLNGEALSDTGPELRLNNIQMNQSGDYGCEAFNNKTLKYETSQPKVISVLENTELTGAPSEEYITEGSNIIMSCSAVSSPDALFKWFLNSSLLPDQGHELRLMNIQSEQSGDYSCQAFNSKTLRYQTSKPATVSVLEKISAASVKPSSNLIVEGKSANLTCEASGSVFNRTWMKDGLNLILKSDMSLSDDNRVLTFKSIKRQDTGEYSCEISNPFNKQEAKYIMIVNYGPENVHIAGKSEVNIQESLKLTCFAHSTPSPIFTWIHNGTVIHSNSAEFTTEAEFSNSGDYTCQAWNIVTQKTSSSAVHRVSVTEKPPGPACSAGCIAGIVITCIVVIAAAGGGGYYIYKRK